LEDPQNKDRLKTVKEQVLDQLIEEIIVLREAAKRGIKVTEEMVEQEYSRTAEANGGEAKFLELEKKYYNLEKKDLKQLIRLKLYRDELYKKVADSGELTKAAEEKAQQVFDQIKNGADFATLAQQYNEDKASPNGDLGFIAKGETVPEFEEAAFSLKAGEVYPKPVKTIYGYHIIKCTDLKADGTRRISHILIRSKSFQDWLEEKQKDYLIWRLLRV